MNVTQDISFRPYLLRALYDWCEAKKHTPCLVVDTTCESVQVPTFTAKDKTIVLNIASAAVRDLTIDSEGVLFTARFLGETFHVVLPMESIVGIYARETQSGLSFLPSSSGDKTGKPIDKNVTQPKKSNRPNFQVV